MPSQRAINKRCIATWVDKSTKRKLEKLASSQGKSLSQLVQEAYTKHLLSPEQYSLDTTPSLLITNAHKTSTTHRKKKQGTACNIRSHPTSCAAKTGSKKRRPDVK